jgi:hypothetical protein
MNDKDNEAISLASQAEKKVDDYYANTVKMAFSIYDVLFEFGKKSLPEDDPERSVLVRMSPQHAKVFALLLRKHLEIYEKDIGEIKIPLKVLKDLGLKKED